jgi:hypothetical protein
MNKYGALAHKHWQQYRPQEYQQIEDPQAYFTDLGAQISQEIGRRRDQDEQQTGAGQTTDYLANLAALNRGQTTIEDDVLREMVYDLVESPAS